MPVPGFQDFILPTLRLAAKGEIKQRDAVQIISDELKLSEEDRAETIPSGVQTTAFNRLSWAVTYLVKAGLAVRPHRGHFTITDEGRGVLKNPPDRVDIKFLSNFEAFKEFKETKNETGTDTAEVIETSESGTPEERIDVAFDDLNDAIRGELLDHVLAMDPAAFERLIIDLMRGMGYGDSGGSGEHVGRTADGGIDGIINEDVLGLDIIYLQAKRYAPGNAIGVEKIREFAGVLDERGVTKGVFVTSSHFAKPATEFAERSPKRLMLIDGAKLTRLMITYGVGVRRYRSLELKKIDTDYFGDFDS